MRYSKMSFVLRTSFNYGFVGTSWLHDITCRKKDVQTSSTVDRTARKGLFHADSPLYETEFYVKNEKMT